MPAGPRPFCRFAGCNLWTGREQDRAAKAICQFCDTDFVGLDGTLGGRYATAAELADAVAAQWTRLALRYVVLTGGEPLLQVDADLIAALHARGFSIGVETNGTIDPPEGMDWICVSPKAGAELRVRQGHELKLVYPQADAAPERFDRSRFRALLVAADGRA